MIWTILLALVSSVMSSEIEVVRISSDLNAHTKTYFWPAKTQGGIYIDDSEISIADGNKIYIQRRGSTHHKWISVKVNNKDDFKIYGILKAYNKYYLNSIWGNGRFYLSVHDMTGVNTSPLVSKHGSPGRMFSFKKDHVLVSGNIRLGYAKALDKYDTNSTFDNNINREKLVELYRTSRSFTLSVYTKNLKLTDSLNVIEREGVDGELYDRLWPSQGVDIDDSENIYLVDNDQGYVIEKYSSPYSCAKEVEVENRMYKPIPKNLTPHMMTELQQKPGTYSMVYALYVKGGYLLTCFYQNSTGRELPSGPFGYDVTTLEGQAVLSGSLHYPVIAEDTGNKVFLYVARPGSWFKQEEMYLIGLTLDDIANGLAEREAIDRAIERYIAEYGVGN